MDKRDIYRLSYKMNDRNITNWFSYFIQFGTRISISSASCFGKLISDAIQTKNVKTGTMYRNCKSRGRNVLVRGATYIVR
jgi:hypothetical protein